MMVSPFTFYRGAALLMAADLARHPEQRIDRPAVRRRPPVELRPVRRAPSADLVFDINDFDETHPGPFEWDVKRLVASVEIAGRYRGFTDQERRANILAAARGYRERMLRAAESGVLEAWYDHLDVDKVQAWLQSQRDEEHAAKQQVKGFDAVVAKARTKDSMQAFSKLVSNESGQLRIIADPPLIVPVEDLVPDGIGAEQTEDAMRDILAAYQPDAAHGEPPARGVHVRAHGAQGRRRRQRRHTRVDRAAARPRRRRSAVPAGEGGSGVGARALPRAVRVRQPGRARRAGPAPHAGARATSSWDGSASRGEDGIERDFYMRQLRDWKGSARRREVLVPRGALLYARICGETLARAHARSGDRVEIAAYLGKSTAFDEAIADFAEAYADQNDADYAAFLAAIESGRLEARQGPVTPRSAPGT